MADSLSLKNHNIMVTGVSRPSGIGTGITRLLAKAGAHIAVHGNTNYDSSLQYPDAKNNYIFELVEELSSEGYKITAITPSDLAAPGEPEKVIAEAAEKLGTLNGLVLNHAYSVHAPVFEWTAENIDAHFNVNVRASMLMIQAFAKQIDKEKGGVVTLFTSGQYLGPMVSEIAYAVSKEAIRGLTSQAAAALATHNIRVNCINPGPTDTNYMKGEAYDEVAKMFPSGRWGMPEDAARLVQFLHSEQARWITGQTIASEGGFVR